DATGPGPAGRAGQDLALALPGTSGGAAEAGAPAAEYGRYLDQYRRRIQELLRYPAPARRRGLSGTVQLELTIGPAGAISQVTVVGSSSHSVLDDAAVETVRSLRPLPFPADLPPRILRVRLPVVFELR
ncbi:MAG: energy transducer TonB, partial [Candidatus Rokubacteria bacterium]|nr:energy transducer TonB [Candidatus Rokubacteria bacterium]